jgi:hypothetical protein
MTEQEAKEFYGADAAEWLQRWDAGRGVWSIEMGGLGPGYEQCIQITAAEILRHMITKQYDVAKWDDKDQLVRDRDEIEAMGHKNTTIKQLGLSGAQWGAAFNLAGMFYRNGPAGVMQDERVADRKIQVQRTFPQAVTA